MEIKLNGNMEMNAYVSYIIVYVSVSGCSHVY